MIKVQVESFTRCFNDIQPLLESHWRELALDQDKVPLDPRWDVYLLQDHEGGVLFVTVRDTGRLLGYFLGFVAPGLHYKTCKTLQMDVFWLHPDLRDGDSLSRLEGDLVADQLFDEVEAEARRRKVKRMFAGSKLHKDASQLFQRRGYIEIERYHSLWLGEQ